MPEFSHHIIPTPMPDVAEMFAVYQTTQAFYDEIRERDAFQQYCHWYEGVAIEHQQTLEQMRGELNIMSWFYRRE